MSARRAPCGRVAGRRPPSQNHILPQQNDPLTEPDVATRIAAATLAKREADYTSEVRRLLDAALSVIAGCGTTSRARVADIVATAGLSNDAFYRHFPSKDDLVAALLQDGTARLAGYVAHQMAKESTPERRVRRWVEGVLSQTQSAATTVAVLWNATRLVPAPRGASDALAALLVEPLTQLGRATPELDATLAAHAVVGRLSDHLWSNTRPSRAEIDRIVAYITDH